MKRKDKFTVVSIIVTIVCILVSIIFFFLVPNKISIQWSAAEPSNIVSKTYIFIMPIISVLTLSIGKKIFRFVVYKYFQRENEKFISYLNMYFNIVFLTCELYVIAYVYGVRLSVEHVIKRVKHALQFKDNINRGTRLLFVDDCFTANGERAINVFKKLHRLYGYTEKVFIEARVTDILKNQILQNIPLQMVSSMQIGVECGYNEGLKKIRKGLTVEQLFSALEILKQYQFDKHCFLSFIIGFPWETMEMINKTLDTIELICTKYKIVCNLNWLLLLPSDLWWEKEDFNIHIEEDMFDNLLWYANSDYFFTTHPLISMEDIIQVEKRIGAMQRQGGTVAYRRRIGNEEDYIEPSACSE